MPNRRPRDAAQTYAQIRFQVRGPRQLRRELFDFDVRRWQHPRDLALVAAGSRRWRSIAVPEQHGLAYPSPFRIASSQTRLFMHIVDALPVERR
jgi:hypothetical protein